MPPLWGGRVGHRLGVFTQRMAMLGAVTLNHMGRKESVHRKGSGLGLRIFAEHLLLTVLQV